jgi:hypothetical protein
MHAVIRNTPAGLIPQELFKSENTQEYWNILYPNLQQESIAAETLGAFFLLHPKTSEEGTIHEISLMYQNIKEKFSNQADAICLNVDNNTLSLLVLKENEIAFTGYFNYAVDEDIVYHLANITRQFFEDVSQITVFYKQLTQKKLHFLNHYFKMKRL